MPHIVLYGEVLADIFPDQTILGGAPYNVTRHLNALKQQPLLISRVGTDKLKTSFFKTMTSQGIDLSAIQVDASSPTGQVKVLLEKGAHRFDICSNQAYDHIDAKAAAAALKAPPTLFYYGTLAQRTPSSRATLSSLLADRPSTTFLDINLRAPWYNETSITHSLSHADIVKLTEEELYEVSDMLLIKRASLAGMVMQLIERFKLATVYITMGEKGASVHLKTGETYSVSGEPVGQQLVDAVGAGDAFSSICILGTLRGWPVKETINKANLFAAEICKIKGATPEQNDFYQPYLAW